MKPDSIYLKLGVFFFSILMGFIIAFMAYMFEKINFIILGFASGS